MGDNDATRWGSGKRRMAADKEDLRYYVVGGPVQPGRACYVQRVADDELFTRLLDGAYSTVVAPADLGKSSLVASTAHRLRSVGVSVAAVDLAQISNRDVAEDVGRWYYSFAYRVVRELRLRPNLQAWWQERSGLTNRQRLREFFLDVVLAEVSGPVVVFVDRIEVVLGLEVSRDLFGAIRACYDARANEPEFGRLSFALLGAELAGQAVPQGNDSPFPISGSVALGDFDLPGVRSLVEGLNLEPVAARAVADRLMHWTAGHPYLTQKILRGLKRRAGVANVEAVDAQVANLFFSGDAAQREPHLLILRNQLVGDAPARVGRLNLYGKIRKGADVRIDAALPLHRNLLRSGAVVADARGRFALRNRVYSAVFSAHWVNQNLPFSLRGISTAAAVILLAIAIPVWYVEYLPRPYADKLRSAEVSFTEAQSAHDRLSMLPGFGGRADRLFAEYLQRISSRATRLTEVQRYGDYLAELDDGEALRRESLATFWDRRREQALKSGDRDRALLFALRAAETPTAERSNALGELLGPDIDRLLWTVRPTGNVTGLGYAADTGTVTILDSQHRLSAWRVDDGGGRLVRSLELAAEEWVPVQSRLVFDGRNSGRRLRASFVFDHPRPADLRVELRAPSGRSVRLPLPVEVNAGGAYQVDSRTARTLRPLLEESPSGTWTANVVDSVRGVTGRLLSWSLDIDGQSVSADPLNTLESGEIPEPTLARVARSALSADGSLALIWPADAAARGNVLVWRTDSGEIVTQLPRSGGFVDARFALGSELVLLTNSRDVAVWTADGRQLRSIPFEPAVRPALSANGRYLVVDSLTGNTAANAVEVWDLETQVERGQLVTGELAELAAVDPTGRFLAVGDDERLVRLWSVVGSSLVAEFEHASAPTSLMFSPNGDWLATQDAAHTLRVWNLNEPGPPVLMRDAGGPWAVSFADSRLLFGANDRGYELISLLDGANLGPVIRHGLPESRRRAISGRALLTGDTAVTTDGAEAVKIWRVAATDLLVARGPAVAGSAAAVAIRHDGQAAAIASTAGDVRLVPAAAPAPVNAGLGALQFKHGAAVSALAFDQDGRYLASGALDGTVAIWNTQQPDAGEVRARLGEGAVLALTFSPDGRWLVAAGRRVAQVIDARLGTTLARTAIQSLDPDIEITADGRDIFIADDRGGVSQWRWENEAVTEAISESTRLTRLALSPDGRIATVGADRRLRLWSADLAPLASRIRLPAHPESIWFTRDGQQLVVKAGLWAYQLSVSAGDVQLDHARFLASAADGVAFDNEAGELLLLSAARSPRPAIRRIDLQMPGPSRIDVTPQTLQARMEGRLQLAIDPWGEPQP